MAMLLNTTGLAKTYGTHTLFEGVRLSLETGERLALIGPNGSGKSTLLKVLAGLEVPDEGELTGRRGLRLAYVGQADEFGEGATPLSVVVERLKGDLPDQTLDAETRAAITLSKLGFTDHDRPVATLSGGWKKRLSIAGAVAAEPDVLMLDEPTNHLDLEGVLWLEEFVKGVGGVAVVVITHDRVFLESVAERVVELSRAYPGGTFEAKGNYSEFVRRKEDFLEAQAAQQSSLANKIRRDTAWLKQGIQGRQTRNKSQIEAASDRRAEMKALKGRNDAPKRTATIDFQATDRKTKRLLAVHGVSKTLGDKTLFERLDLELSPGKRLGLLGPNGSGKTTLLKLLTGDLEPDAGTVKPAAELRVVNFTQHREALNPTQKLREALCPVGDVVDYQGKPMHVSAWAGKFLFDRGQFNTSVGDLSGGEQARILIANLMLKPADVLILDEPTNDLDIPSLEVLEQSLMEFPGAIVLVTHDRFMLQRVSTELLALDGEGTAKGFVSYEQYEAWWAGRGDSPSAIEDKPVTEKTKPAAGGGGKKLTYKLQRELDGMEERILDAESRLEAWKEKVGDERLMADREAYAAACEAMGATQEEVEGLYARWAELEEMAG
ncbi:MAG: ABC-F family ATP-binding cassette domain-containing protein [Planctomycetota bacterium]